MAEYEFHEAANIFPLDEEHLGELAEDIKREGLLCPVEVFDGKIIDGRRRWLACKKAGAKPEVVKVSPADPVAYVISLNLKRRQLTKSQAGACAARAEKLREKYAEEAKERQKRKPSDFVPPNCAEQTKPETRDRLAEDFGVSHGTVDRAARAIRDGIPELAEALDAGKITANAASQIAAYPKSAQREMLQDLLKKKRSRRSPSRNEQSSSRKSSEAKEREKDRRLTERFAINTVDVAMTQLKAIPPQNEFRAREFSRVQSYLEKEIAR